MKKHKGFNHEYAKSVSRDEFIKQHAHLTHVDLGGVWDEINDKPAKQETKKPVEGK
jgi:hypothetical protein